MDIPKISDIYTNILASMYAFLGIQIDPKSIRYETAMAKADSAILWSIWAYGGKVQQNCYPDLAESEVDGGTLERFGRVKLGRVQFEAIPAEYSATATGSIGAVISAGQTFKSDDTSKNPGKIYILDTEFTFTATTGTINLRCLEAGLAGKLDDGDTLTATNPIPLVEYVVVVDSELVEPFDRESNEDYRAKIIESYQLEPQGGAAADFRLWSYDVVGVKQTYVYARSSDSANLNVFVESSSGDGTASGPLLTQVAAVLENDPDTSLQGYETGRRPMGVQQVHCLSVTPADIEITINGYVGATPEIQTKINASIVDMVSKIRPFVGAIDKLIEKNDTIDSNKVTYAVLSAVPGSVFGAVQIKVDSVIVTSYVFAPTLGNTLSIPKTPTVLYV